MVASVTFDPADQRRRRRRAGKPGDRISQGDIARVLGISVTSVSDYEQGKKSLPLELTPEDYERALQQVIRERGEAS